MPEKETVADGAPAAFLAEVEKAARELVRAAEALHLHGPAHQEADEGARQAFVVGGFFGYVVAPRSELVTIRQVTADPALRRAGGFGIEGAHGPGAGACVRIRTVPGHRARHRSSKHA
ncbi:hypothetical protein [Streptomyces poriticola]|uniref:hypothetical protein n=1 Tax=Streptomyces poriticola TaxID=3120506 RepID=UPI002FCE111A